jgi:phosphatidylserine decarboxylase
MKHAGKATKAGLKLILWTLILLLTVIGIGILATVLGTLIAAIATSLIAIWLLFVIFTLFFFRDPTPHTPMVDTAIVSPGHGKVDVIDEVEEPEFIEGRCRRISIFLSVFNVHVQNAPVAGRVAFVRYTPGQFLNALKLESAQNNENVLLGFDSSERPNERIGVRLIAGLIARRIVNWLALGDTVTRGERISLIQFGSRVDLYLPLAAKVQVKLGDKVVGGETIVATRD